MLRILASNVVRLVPRDASETKGLGRARLALSLGAGRSASRFSEASANLTARVVAFTDPPFVLSTRHDIARVWKLLRHVPVYRVGCEQVKMCGAEWARGRVSSFSLRHAER